MPRRLPILAALLLVVATACGDEPSVRVPVDRVHDLIALFPRAEAEGRSPYTLGQRADVDDAVDTRDGTAYLRAAPGASYTFRDLATHGRATLSFGLGVVVGEEEPRPGPVTFRVEGREPRATGGAWTVLFEESHPPARFEPPALREDRTVALPGEGDASWTLRFSAELTSGGQGRRAWPGWFSPVLRSDGRLVPIEERAVPDWRVADDLLARLDDADVVEQRADVPVALARLDAAEGVNVHGGPRDALVAAAPARVRFTVDVPRGGAHLEFACGVDTARGWSLGGDGMTFAVDVDGTRVWSRTLDAPAVEVERGWKPVTLDLARWEGRAVDLAFVTEPGADDAHDVGGFANPRVLVRSTRPRLPAGAAPNVLVIVVDTLRADALGCYGAPGDPTPRLDAFAAESVRFTESRSVSSFTWPATGTILTGLYPHAHGVVGRKRAFLADPLLTTAELFADAGYSTGAFVANPIVGSETNFHQGFETFVNVPQARGRALLERVMLWTEQQEGTALMAYVHLFDPHDPYVPPAAFAPELDIDAVETALDDVAIRHMAALHEGDVDDSWGPEKVDLFGRSVRLDELRYDAEVRSTDTVVGELLDAWEAAGLLEDAVVVFTSDHGEEFYEHGRPYHGTTLYEEAIRVPLWVRGHGPRAVPPRTSDVPAGVIDILPTLLDATGVDAPPYALPGRSLLRPLPQEFSFAHTASGIEPGHDEALDRFAATLPPWKLVWTPGAGLVQLFDLATDPREATDVAAQHPDVVERMQAAIDAWLAETVAAAPEQDGTVGAEMQAWLEALGYTGK